MQLVGGLSWKGEQGRKDTLSLAQAPGGGGGLCGAVDLDAGVIRMIFACPFPCYLWSSRGRKGRVWKQIKTFSWLHAFFSLQTEVSGSHKCRQAWSLGAFWELQRSRFQPRSCLLRRTAVAVLGSAIHCCQVPIQSLSEHINISGSRLPPHPITEIALAQPCRLCVEADDLFIYFSFLEGREFPWRSWDLCFSSP